MPESTPAPSLPNGLVYVSDATPGIRRLRRGSGFTYRGVDGKPVRDAATLARIRSLAIPPAYVDVWICPRPDGHLQATGRDARGRKQYRYHPDFRAVREAWKFDRLPHFGRALPQLRQRVAQDLEEAARGGPPTRVGVIAAIVRLLDTTFARIGNQEYARKNQSYGVTTLRRSHVKVQGHVLHLRFRGKSGRQHELSVDDARLARVVRRCQELPGQELFQFAAADGTTHAVGSGDVNDYLEQVTGERFTAKDFRTWQGSVQALALLCEAQSAGTPPVLSPIVSEVARRLGNTAAVCRKAYIHPHVLQLVQSAAPYSARAVRLRGLSVDERRLLHLLDLRPRKRVSKRQAAVS